MKLLLDTHALLWALAAPEELTPETRAAITDGHTTVLVSAVSAWEIAFKRGLGKLDFDSDLPVLLAATRFAELPISVEHAVGVAELPDHHRDPFDRMLIAQANAEGATLVTRDDRFADYDVETLPA